MKHLTFLFLFLSFINHINSQIPVWNIETDVTAATNIPQGSIQIDGEHFLLYSQKRIIELDALGTIIAAASGPNNNLVTGYGEFIRKKIDPQTAQPYFLLSSGQVSATNALTISEYYPGPGFINETTLEESGGTVPKSPFFIALNDSVFFILGRKYFRQITHHSNHTIAVNWQKANTIGITTGGTLIADGVVGITQDGHIFALDGLGNTLWNNPAPLGLRHIEKVEDGFLACGRVNSVDSTIIIKFSDDGSILWNKFFPGQSYEFLLAEPDGSITVTGQSDSLHVLLHHLDQEGNTIWQKTYQSGTGTSLLRTLDGGYLIAGLTSTKHYIVIKTDSFGNTGPLKTEQSAQNRKLENDLMSSVFFPAATLFFNTTASTFFVPKEDKTTMFFAAAPWIGGLDESNNLHIAASTYPNLGKSDYRSGIAAICAIDTGRVLFNNCNNNDLNRVWAVSQTEIQALQQDWLDNGVINQSVPYDILTWPAKGNMDFRYNNAFLEVSLDRDLLPAPFVDVNGDGKYSIYDGDYPRIKGDQMAWWTLTDDVVHSVSSGTAFYMDMYVSAYMYNCQSEKLNQSLFVDFELINRSNNIYKDVFAGIWSDPDLGCAYDDYIGSLPDVNAFYTYNQDSIDGYFGTTCPYSMPTFADHPPVGSISFTNTTLNKFGYYNNAAGTPPPLPGTSDPYDSEEYYYYLQGEWGDGSTPTYNGQPINYAFPDNPADSTGNSMCSASLPPGDRRMIGSHGPFNFAPGDTFLLKTAFTYHPDIPLPCPDIFGTIKNDLEELQNLVNSGALDAPANLPAIIYLSPGQSVILDATVPGATTYLWSNGATRPVISINQTGIYTVTITRSTGCSSIEIVSVQSTTSSEIAAAWPDQFRLFPNPANGQFTVEMQGIAQEKVVFTLINTIGQIVEEQTVDFSSGNLRQLFDYNRLPVGVYTLRVGSGERTLNKKVVIER